MRVVFLDAILDQPALILRLLRHFFARRVAHRETRRDAHRTQHHDHRGGVVVAVALLNVVEEVVDRIGAGRRRGDPLIVRVRP